MSKITKDITEIEKICNEKYGIKVGNNAKYIFDKIFEISKKSKSIKYVECGVYQGTTLIPIYYFCQNYFEDFSIYAIDSFSGFPSDSIHPNDEFDNFFELHKYKLISNEHLRLAKERFKTLKLNEHITEDYFSNYENQFSDRIKDKPEVNKIKCSFKNLGTHKILKNRFDLVFLDCDLFESYNYCLNFFKSRTKLFVLDEYYSLKYPGARIAVNEFNLKNKNWKLSKKIEHNPYFERWSMIKTNGK